MFTNCDDTQLNHLTDLLLTLHQLPDELSEAFVHLNANDLIACCAVSGRMSDLQNLYDNRQAFLSAAFAREITLGRWP